MTVGGGLGSGTAVVATIPIDGKSAVDALARGA
jgi:hypothetical protein